MVPELSGHGGFGLRSGDAEDVGGFSVNGRERKTSGFRPVRVRNVADGGSRDEAGDAPKTGCALPRV